MVLAVVPNDIENITLLVKQAFVDSAGPVASSWHVSSARASRPCESVFVVHDTGARELMRATFHFEKGHLTFFHASGRLIKTAISS